MTETAALPTTLEQVNGKAPDSGPKTRPYVPDRRSVILALCQFPEPGKVSAIEVAAVAQAIHHKLGGTNNINKKHIKTLVSKLRKKFDDENLTQDRVREIASNLYGRKAVAGDYSSLTKTRKGPAPSKTTEPTKSRAKKSPAKPGQPKAETVRVDDLLEAATFVKTVGRQSALTTLETYLVITQQ